SSRTAASTSAAGTNSKGGGKAGAAGGKAAAGPGAIAAGRKRRSGKGAKVAATNFLNYPRAGKRNPWRWIPSLRMVLGVMALGVLVFRGGAVWAYNETDVPEPSDFALAQTSRVYFSVGETEMGHFSVINRTVVPDDEIPDN